ncbi:hypothetical protein ACQEVZ_02760 [Dactylosporangium sp. CA-152071]|uniref:hypothetical protein n=1 Tax=Dactylosporangium sp. CA-152071 TaxID=3239933 RepID=UPI003D905808
MFADPEAVLRNRRPRCNADVSGAVVLQMAATDADCDGILVTSATEQVRLVISRSTARSLVASAGKAKPCRRWWNRR